MKSPIHSGGTMSEEQVLPEFIATLKAAAEKATLGPYSPSPAACGALMKVRGGLGKNIADLRYTNGIADTVYFSQASPENILKLIELLAQSEAERERLQGELGQCYILSGADPDMDADEPWRLAPHAVREVKRLREESDEVDSELTTVLARESAATARHDAKLEQLETELARERERNQELRLATLMEALKAVENERLECHYSVLADPTDIAYSRAIHDAEDAIKQLLEPQPAPVATGEE